MTSATDRKVAKEFCRVIREVPPGYIVTLDQIQGMVRGVDLNSIPDQEEYEPHLKLAIKWGWLEPVTGKLDTYERKVGRNRWQDLADQIIRAIEKSQ